MKSAHFPDAALEIELAPFMMSWSFNPNPNPKVNTSPMFPHVLSFKYLNMLLAAAAPTTTTVAAVAADADAAAA